MSDFIFNPEKGFDPGEIGADPSQLPVVHKLNPLFEQFNKVNIPLTPGGGQIGSGKPTLHVGELTDTAPVGFAFKGKSPEGHTVIYDYKSDYTPEAVSIETSNGNKLFNPDEVNFPPHPAAQPPKPSLHVGELEISFPAHSGIPLELKGKTAEGGKIFYNYTKEGAPVSADIYDADGSYKAYYSAKDGTYEFPPAPKPFVEPTKISPSYVEGAGGVHYEESTFDPNKPEEQHTEPLHLLSKDSSGSTWKAPLENGGHIEYTYDKNNEPLNAYKYNKEGQYLGPESGGNINFPVSPDVYKAPSKFLGVKVEPNEVQKAASIDPETIYQGMGGWAHYKNYDPEKTEFQFTAAPKFNGAKSKSEEDIQAYNWLMPNGHMVVKYKGNEPQIGLIYGKNSDLIKTVSPEEANLPVHPYIQIPFDAPKTWSAESSKPETVHDKYSTQFATYKNFDDDKPEFELAGPPLKTSYASNVSIWPLKNGNELYVGYENGKPNSIAEFAKHGDLVKEYNISDVNVPEHPDTKPDDIIPAKSPKGWESVGGPSPKPDLSNVPIHEFIASQKPITEPDFTAHSSLATAAGVIIKEPDGSVWLMHPKGQYGGYKATFPKGRPEPGESLQQAAIREAFEETGLKVKLVKYLGDFDKTTTRTRYFLAERADDNQPSPGPESEKVTLVHPNDLSKIADHPSDQPIIDAILGKSKPLPSSTPRETPYPELKLLRQLTPEEISTVKEYTDSYYDDLNTYLRRKNDLKNEDFTRDEYKENNIRRLDSAIAAHPMEHEITTYRAMDNDTFKRLDRRLEPGDSWVHHGYVSASTSENFARGWKSGDVLVITTPKGSPALPVLHRVSDFEVEQGFSNHTTEKELILPRDVRLRLTKKEHRTLYFEVVPDAQLPPVPRTKANWVEPSYSNLEQEYNVEYQKHFKTEENDPFPTKYDFIDAVQAAPTVTLTREMDQQIENRSHTSNMESLHDLISGYRSYPEFRNKDTLTALETRIKSGDEVHMPIVFKFPDGRMRVLGGNTRLDIAFMHHDTADVKMVEVPYGR